ncbi:MAG: DivIVA domain-containing protein, partial [Clostridia bacterium]|nr:DivIVA domain-containing protein [Clostridia bacterium]
MNKMSVGFRKSFLGFNCEDVMSYIEDSHKSFMKKEEELNGKISELNKTVSNLSSDIEDLNKTNEALQDKVKEYTSKQDEIERLSQNIGKLYLVAQSNAKAIVKNSVDSIGIASNEV